MIFIIHCCAKRYFPTRFYIPPIKEESISEWLQIVKSTMADLVGFEDGLFYDMLIITAYSKQFIEEKMPLSDKQIQNIKNYYKGEEMEKLLLLEDEEVIRFKQSRLKTNINKTPAVAKEKLMEFIVSKYSNKVIVVDYWATWCAPCLEAISELREMEINYINKDVVFVHITTESSPKDIWEKKIWGIGGEHYYLKQDE